MIDSEEVHGEAAADVPVVTVVLPAYNEEALIEASLDAVCSHMRSIENLTEWEVIVVDDGSADRTGEIVADYCLKEPRVRLLSHEVNKNLGESLRYAFREARGHYVVTLDADMSYSADHVEDLLGAIVETGAQVVIASPYVKGGTVTAVPRMRELLSRAANRLLSMTAKGHLTTVTGMARAYQRSFLESLDLKAWDFEINTEIVFKAQLLRARIVEIPGHLDWTGQQSVGDLRRSSIRFTRSIAAQAFSSFLFRPFAYFIVPGVVVLALSLYTLAWAVYHTFDAWLRDDVTTFSSAVAEAFQLSPHSFVVGGLSLLVGIQLISLGVLSAQNKRYFDEVFHLGTTIHRYQIEHDRRSAPYTGDN